MEILDIVSRGVEIALFLWALQIERRLAKLEGKLCEFIQDARDRRNRYG